MTKKNGTNMIPIDIEVNEFNTQKLTDLKEALKNIPIQEPSYDENQKIKKIKPLTKVYYVREVKTFNYTNILHFRVEKIKANILNFLYKCTKNKEKSQKIQILIDYLNSLLATQKSERKLIDSIGNSPLTYSEEKMREEIAFLYAIEKFNINRVDLLQNVKRLLKQNNFDKDKLNLETHEKDVNNILEKVKKR